MLGAGAKSDAGGSDGGASLRVRADERRCSASTKRPAARMRSRSIKIVRKDSIEAEQRTEVRSSEMPSRTIHDSRQEGLNLSRRRIFEIRRSSGAVSWIGKMRNIYMDWLRLAQQQGVHAMEGAGIAKMLGEGQSICSPVLLESQSFTLFLGRFHSEKAKTASRLSQFVVKQASAR
jgi:hypothetical protein